MLNACLASAKEGFRRMNCESFDSCAIVLYPRRIALD